MAEFHFIRPLWLLVLPVAIWLAWHFGLGRGGRDGWSKLVDRPLQAHVLADGGQGSQRRVPLLIALAASVLAALALAGPSWDRMEVPTFRSSAALVIALDLSRSMDAGDLEPSRLVRARLKLLDLLERRQGELTALVAFSSNAFTVTPLTNDTKTIAALVSALSTDIMPSQGSLIETGLEKAASLLVQGGNYDGEILLMTDATASPAALDLAADLKADGITTHVLGVGTAQGAPIADTAGGFVTDRDGNVVVPMLDTASLQRLATAGGGRLAQLSFDDADLDRLFPASAMTGAVGTRENTSRETEIWYDKGIWLTLIVLPLLLIAFRRGWVYGLLAVIVLPVADAEALEWNDLWQRSDQQAANALENGDAEQAAALFRDPEWLAAAQYRAGQYEQSATTLSGLDTVAANYNRGNALARAGRLPEAIEAYDRTLELAADHEDAAYNRELVADLLEQQQQQQQEQDQQGESGDEQQQQQQQEDSSESGSESQSSQSETGEDSESGESSANDEAGAGQDEQMAGSSPAEDNGDEAGTDGESSDEPGNGEDDETLQAAASTDDIDDWASEQAADQWLRRIPQDPGGLLRRKFQYQYREYGRDQDGNAIYPGSESEPW